MKTMNFADLIANIDTLPYNTGIYTEMFRWVASPLEAPLYLSSSDEEQEEGFDDHIEERGLREFFQLPTLQDIVEVERRTRPQCTLEDFVAAANYYRQYDTFRP